MALSINDFALKQIELLEIERKAEADVSTELLASHAPATLARLGLAVTNLQIAATRTGPGGKTVVELEPDAATAKELGAHGLRVGDLVRLAEMPSGSAKKRERQDRDRHGADGVICRTQEAKVSVVLDNEDAEVPRDKRVWLVKLANDVTYKRMNQTMTKLSKSADSDLSPLSKTLAGRSSPSPVSSSLLNRLEASIDWTRYALNESQKAAVTFALASQEVALIHGPPGTGKTHTLIAIISELVNAGKRVLVCGPSNISVDNICDRLSTRGMSMVRLGHPARLLPSVIDHSLDVLTQTSDAGGIVKDIRREMDSLQTSLKKKMAYSERRAAYSELKLLRKEFRQREKKCIADLVREARVVLATLHGAGGWQLGNQSFDVVIVDEASQALEAQTWIPVLWTAASKLILAGDHLQLPPTIKSLNRPEVGSTGAKQSSINLETTIFDRLLATHGSKIKKMLTIQYRMHQQIMRFPSDELYDAQLVADESVKEHMLVDLPYPVKHTEDTTEPLVFLDTQGGDFVECAEEDISRGANLGESKSNRGEAMLARAHVAALIDAGVPATDIAVITPYNAQLSLLTKLLRERFPGVELGSVDGFQGREKEAVIVSLVRSGAEVGFLADKRRLNVSMTRPKRHLCIIGDSATLSKGGKFLKDWMSFLEEHADLRYPDVHTLNTDVN